MENNHIKFAIIIICLLIALAGRRDAHDKRDAWLLAAAMALTLGADFFLVILFNYPPGLIFFCAVQSVYILRFGGIRALRVAPAAAIIPLTYFALTGDLLIGLALAYAQLFLFSYSCMIRAVRRGKFPRPNAVLVVLGMSLFVLCDISVAAWNLGRMGIAQNEAVVGFAQNAMWLFYAPSQVCLAMSGMRFERPTRGELYPGSSPG